MGVQATAKISKELFLTGLHCPVLGWMQDNGQYTENFSLVYVLLNV
jgi:hypothetical protein